MRAIAIQRNRKRRVRFSWAKMVAWGRPVLFALLLGGLFFGLYAGSRRLATAPFFEVREIRWQGLRHLKEAEMTARFRSILGRNLFRLDLADIQGQLQANPWVKEAVVRKDFPDQLTFIVTERVPTAVEIEASRGPILRDQEGAILERGGTPPEALPRLLHYNPASYAKGLQLASFLSESLKREAADGRPAFVVDLADPEDLVVHLSEGVLHFGEGDYLERWQRFLEIRSDLERRGIANREIDLRFQKKVVVKGGFTRGRGGVDLPGWSGDQRKSSF
ncbi:MAG: FtsQ-type POTRA domain-containing protein [Nitrospirae bacterium]|nr:FtsQ-type POTRA domain-containing protein [Candidatus Manganitrophaceae bacterium]